MPEDIAGTATGSGGIDNSGAVVAKFDIGSVKVGGSLIGNATNAATILAHGQEFPGATNFAIKSVEVGGRAEFAQILGDYDIGFPVIASNPDAQIGSVKVVGDWISSRLAAGTNVGGEQSRRR